MSPLWLYGPLSRRAWCMLIADLDVIADISSLDQGWGYCCFSPSARSSCIFITCCHVQKPTPAETFFLTQYPCTALHKRNEKKNIKSKTYACALRKTDVVRHTINHASTSLPHSPGAAHTHILFSKSAHEQTPQWYTKKKNSRSPLHHLFHTPSPTHPYPTHPTPLLINTMVRINFFSLLSPFFFFKKNQTSLPHAQSSQKTNSNHHSPK